MAQFEESKHPRDEDGKFTDKNKNKSYVDQVNERVKWAIENGIDLPLSSDGSVDDLKLQEKINSGGKSGALNPDKEEDSKRTQSHANMMYQEISKRTGDISKVAKSANISEQQAKQIKDYVFNNEEFTPDFDQALTWQRLSEGNPLEEDLIFIKHELLEIKYREDGLSYKEAHKLAENNYNYGKAVKERRYGKTNKKGNNN